MLLATTCHRIKQAKPWALEDLKVLPDLWVAQETLVDLWADLWVAQETSVDLWVAQETSVDLWVDLWVAQETSVDLWVAMADQWVASVAQVWAT